MTDYTKVKNCCALCDNYYNEQNCPLYKTYNTAENYGENHFDKHAKYLILCDNFIIDKRLITYSNE